MSEQIPSRIPQQQVPPGWYPDPSMGMQQRWWDGYQWGPIAPPVHVPKPASSSGTWALIFAISGFFLMGIPFFIGWFLGGPLDILAIIFGVIAITVSPMRRGAGLARGVVAICIASISLISVFFGAGSIW